VPVIRFRRQESLLFPALIHATPYNISIGAHIELHNIDNKIIKTNEAMVRNIRSRSCQINNERIGPRIIASKRGMPKKANIPIPITPASPLVAPSEAESSEIIRNDAQKEIRPNTLNAI